MARSGIFYTSVMVAALAAALWVSERRGKGGEGRGGERLLGVSADDVQSVALRTEKADVTTTRRENTTGRFWVSFRDPAKASEPTLNFLSSDTMQDILDALANFQSKRSLGEKSDKDLEAYGLNSESRLEIGTAGEKIEFRIGRLSYGTQDRYVMRTRDKKVFLISAQFLDNLEKAPARLFERSLLHFKPEEATAIDIALGEKVLTLVAKPAPEGQRSWMKEGSDQVSTSASAWVDKFIRSRVMSYEDSAVAETWSKADDLYTVTFRKGDTVLEKIAVKQIPPTDTGAGTDAAVPSSSNPQDAGDKAAVLLSGAKFAVRTDSRVAALKDELPSLF